MNQTSLNNTNNSSDTKQNLTSVTNKSTETSTTKVSNSTTTSTTKVSNSTSNVTKYYNVTVNVPYKYYYKAKVKVAHKKSVRQRYKKWYRSSYKTYYKYRGKWYTKWKYSWKYKYRYRWVKKTYYTYKYKWTYKIKYKKVTKLTTTPPKATAATTTVTTSTYLKSSKNCQVTNSKIKSLAASLTKGVTSTKSKATKIFNWVRDKVSYSFYYNTKYGAVKTLASRKGNCVDQSHLLTALMRAAGIKTRYGHGQSRFTSGRSYGHVWSEVFIGGKWIKADASSSRNSLGIVKSWSLVYMKGRYASLPF